MGDLASVFQDAVGSNEPTLTPYRESALDVVGNAIRGDARPGDFRYRLADGLVGSTGLGVQNPHAPGAILDDSAAAWQRYQDKLDQKNYIGAAEDFAGLLGVWGTPKSIPLAPELRAGYERARDMLSKGANADDIWATTGRALLPDNTLRHVIAGGRDARIRPEYEDRLNNGIKFGTPDSKSPNNFYLGEVLDFPQLFRENPELRGAPVQMMARRGAPYESSIERKIGELPLFTLFTNNINLRSGESNMYDLLHHELNHGVDAIHGYPPGTSPERMAMSRHEVLTNGLSKYPEEMQREFERVFADGRGSYLSGEDVYRRWQPEVMSRLSEYHRRMTDSAIQAEPLRDTLIRNGDYVRWGQIIPPWWGKNHPQ